MSNNFSAVHVFARETASVVVCSVIGSETRKTNANRSQCCKTLKYTCFYVIQ